MAFENISKVEFTSSGKSVLLHNTVIIETSSNKQAEFIANCFNIQQRYDISKLEESVKALENISFSKKDNYSLKMAIQEAEQLLKEIKK